MAVVAAADLCKFGTKLWVYDGDGLPIVISPPFPGSYAAVRVAELSNGVVSGCAVDYREAKKDHGLYRVVERYFRAYIDATESLVSRRNYASAAVKYRAAAGDVHPSVPVLASMLGPEFAAMRHFMSETDVAVCAAVSVYGSIHANAIPVAIEAVETVSPRSWHGPVLLASRLCATDVPVCKYTRCSLLSVATAMYAGAVCWYLQAHSSATLPMPAAIVDAFCDSGAFVLYASRGVTAACEMVMEILVGAAGALTASPPPHVISWYLSATMPWRYAFGVSGGAFLAFENSEPITGNRFGFSAVKDWDTFYAAYVAPPFRPAADPTPALIKAFAPARPAISTKALSGTPLHSVSRPEFTAPAFTNDIAVAAGGLCNE